MTTMADSEITPPLTATQAAKLLNVVVAGETKEVRALGVK